MTLLQPSAGEPVISICSSGELIRLELPVLQTRPNSFQESVDKSRDLQERHSETIPCPKPRDPPLQVIGSTWSTLDTSWCMSSTNFEKRADRNRNSCLNLANLSMYFGPGSYRSAAPLDRRVSKIAAASTRLLCCSTLLPVLPSLSGVKVAAPQSLRAEKGREWRVNLLE